MLVATGQRVEKRTAESINEKIRRRTESNLAYFAAHPDEIPRRLRELDAEWDVERALEALASSFSLVGLAMGVLRSRRWLLLPVAVQSFFLQHALQGWCPPLPVLRRLGFRTAREIDRERCALERHINHHATGSRRTMLYRRR